MAQFLEIHTQDPQPRLISQAVAQIRQGAVVVYPTDSGYALGCGLDEKSAVDRIRQIRRLDKKHMFTLICRDLSEISTYAQVNNMAYRQLRSHTPGHYTFILRATREVPRRLQDDKRKTVGIRVPENRVAQALLDALGEPLLSCSLILPDDESPLLDAEEILDRVGSQVDLVINGGFCGDDPTTVVDLQGDSPIVLREGKGNCDAFAE
ncbi:L-threonylcarbamoyladenylate synthase [Pelagibaculum spongiae]|uniref:Threonylcarbamoyl-AMP synthase n=1 Tax=Pelagibaculum spongiae TaxID=2080658 RepID=A0A2V1GXZ3_9GAMM|nr:L-threonylcarbamoyladenylate synthase [Pelagibaculum spongiae]PVZ71646.1 threonylcarbamoyl-AMP synthase [Pelagibaculum spongiae]